MRNEILEIITETGSIFSNKSVFQINYVPEVWRFRERQYKLMATYCKNLSEDLAPKHLLLTGGYATGKTTTLKQFLALLNDNFSNIRTVYINCKLYKTEHSIYSEIYKQLLNIPKSTQGYNSKYLFEKIISKIVDEKIILIIALDDFDNIKNRKELNNTLYNLLRIHETEPSAQISIFTVSNLGDLLLDDIVQTVFNRAEIRFTNYTLEQTYEILLERCRCGFYEGVIDNNTIRIIAERTYYRKDLRYGINLLSQLGDLAEAKGESVVRFRSIK